MFLFEKNKEKNVKRNETKVLNSWMNVQDTATQYTPRPDRFQARREVQKSGGARQLRVMQIGEFKANYFPVS